MWEQNTVDRRSMVKGLGAAGLAGLAGCLGDDDAEYVRPIEVESIPPAEYEDDLVVWNWYPGYRDWAVEEFTNEYDVDVATEGYADASEWYSRLEAGNHQIDNVGSSPYWTDLSIREGYAEPLPVDLMESWEALPEIATEYVEDHYERDGDIYAMVQTITQYPTLTYNEEHFDSPPDSWDVLWDEGLEDEMFMWDDAVVACGIGAWYTGQDPTDPDDFDEIQEVLEQQEPLNVTYWEDFNQARGMFLNEEVVVGPLLDGQTYTARFQDEAPVNFTVPQEGSWMATDDLLIPTDCPSPRASVFFLDWMCRPDNIKNMLFESGYRPPAEGTDLDELYADELEAGEITQEEIDFLKWDVEYEDRLTFLGPIDDDLQNQYVEIWTEVKA